MHLAQNSSAARCCCEAYGHVALIRRIGTAPHSLIIVCGGVQVDAEGVEEATVQYNVSSVPSFVLLKVRSSSPNSFRSTASTCPSTFCMHARGGTHTATHTCAHTHHAPQGRTRGHMHTHAHTHARAHTPYNTGSYTRPHAHTCAHTHARTHTHTHTHTHTQGGKNEKRKHTHTHRAALSQAS